MKFLTESDYNITICKFHKDDFILRDNFVILIGHYKNDNTKLPPLENKKIFIPKAQVAEYQNYIYIPEDQLSDIAKFNRWSFPTYLDKQVKSKKYWLDLKTKHPYQGK